MCLNEDNEQRFSVGMERVVVRLVVSLISNDNFLNRRYPTPNKALDRGLDTLRALTSRSRLGFTPFYKI